MSLSARPKSVTLGINTLYISLIISVVLSIINIVRVSVDTKYLDTSPQPVPLHYGSMIAIVVVGAIIGWAFIFLMSKGKNWARIIYFIIFVLGLLSWTINFEVTLAQGIFALIAAIVHSCLSALGFIYLLTPSSNRWFKDCKKLGHEG